MTLECQRTAMFVDIARFGDVWRIRLVYRTDGELGAGLIAIFTPSEESNAAQPL